VTRKILTLAMLLATALIAFPYDSYAARSSRETAPSYTESSGMQDWRWQRRQRRRQNRRWSRSMGYRNYGQYRRTRVGNRRFRMVRRTFWNDGYRQTRYVRIYY
jgi:hypothetical protein